MPVSCDNSVLKNIQDIKEQIQSVIEVKRGGDVPIGLLIAMKSTFRCTLCLMTIRPPLITTRCCKNILGCEKCVMKLFQGVGGTTKQCPMCRADRAYTETCRLNGVDDFLKTIYPLLEDSSDDELEDAFRI